MKPIFEEHAVKNETLNLSFDSIDSSKP